jgi:hypothetical protein
LLRPGPHWRVPLPFRCDQRHGDGAL